MIMSGLKAPGSAQITPKAGLVTESPTPDSEFVKVKKDIEILKVVDPFNVVEMAIELSVERIRSLEAIKARDAVVHRLVDAQESLRQKSATVELLQQTIQQKSRTSSPFMSELISSTERIEIARLKSEISQLEQTIVELRTEIRLLQEKQNAFKANEPPPCYEEGAVKEGSVKATTNSKASPQQLLPEIPRAPPRPIRSSSFPQTSQSTSSALPAEPDTYINEACSDYRVPPYLPASDEPADMIAARNTILSNLTLPEEVPDDTLSPLCIPALLTLQDFIASLSGPLRTSIAQYRLFYAATTLWCPEREEHGYFYAPIFKCSTNPRVATAHRWNAVDVIARMNKPTECFFNKDGIWYYAGVYKAFRLADLNTKEWVELPTETTQAIVKETIAARKNTSPQNIYEITQLYAAGALKVACVGLQCVGFNNAMYKSLLEQARAFTQSKWAMGAASSNASLGKASPVPVPPTPANLSAATALGSGSAWNANANANVSMTVGVGSGTVVCGVSPVYPGEETGDIVNALTGISLGRRSQAGHRDENVPAPIGDGRKR